MIELLLASEDLAALRSQVVDFPNERCAVLFTNEASQDSTTKLLVREFQFPSPPDYNKSGPLEAELNPRFVARITKVANSKRSGLVFVHSHPGSMPPLFSATDSLGEARLAAFLDYRCPDYTHAALVISAGGVRARRLGSDESIRVISQGETREDLSEPQNVSSEDVGRFDRQIRAFGTAGQEVLQSLTIAVVGLGGTGSLVAQQLVHLGVRRFILIDADIIEASNLNRVVGATGDDISLPKVNVAARYIQAVAKDADVRCVEGDIMRRAVARELLKADLVFGCTDSHGSRAVLQQVSYQYMIPCVDMGVTIAVTKNSISHIYGRVQLLAPGLACLTCGGLLDANQVRYDMMTAFERQADPYVQGLHEPAPAVISLNGTVASLAVTMMLAVVTSFPMSARHILYNAITSTLRTVRARPKPECYICSRLGAFARGDSWPLFARET